MITEKSVKMLVRSFNEIRYRFQEMPPARFENNYGIYAHVPFCTSFCPFCPFYKELMSDELKNKYLNAIVREINQKEIHGSPDWIYFGGGTPNLLSIAELSRILGEFRKKVNCKNIGMELLPELVTDEYLKGLKEIGFTKVSFGVESFHEGVLTGTNRKSVRPERLAGMIGLAVRLGIWSNCDLMVGLPGQDRENILEDVKMIGDTGPSQVTIYPYMVIRNVSSKPGMNNMSQFQLIEEAALILRSYGYERKGIWIFAKGNDIYDSSRDELVTDYAGFGPAAFSNYGKWKVVNPELSVYLKNNEMNKNMAIVAPKTKASDDWRLFARMIYDLDCSTSPKKPFYMNAFIRILQLAGYSRKGKMGEKGILFAHEITKTVVESLPYPLQNRRIIENYRDYELFKIG